MTLSQRTGNGLLRVSMTPRENISCVKFAPTGTTFVSGSWDQHAYLCDAVTGQLERKYNCQFPVLDVDFLDEKNLLCVGLSPKLRLLDVETASEIACIEKCHESTIRKVCAVDRNIFITGSWDRKVKMWDVRSMKNIATNAVGAKVFCMDVDKENRCVVGGSDKKIHVFDYKNNLARLQERESPLKYQIRSISCMPNGLGFVHGSVEGRASWEYFEQDRGKKFAFKCHREKQKEKEHIYPVHDIAFHPKHGTFATCGGDGRLIMWDGRAKTKMWKTTNFDDEVVSVDFSACGEYLAMAVSSTDCNRFQPNEVWIKKVRDEEVKSRRG